MKWGILGTGYVANLMASAITQSHNNSIEAVASRESQHAQDFAKKHSAKTYYDDYQALLNDQNVDIVYIALPNTLHEEWIIKSAQAGKHILCEKPFTINTAAAQRALDAVEKADVFCMEAFMYACHPQIAKLLELIENNTIGKIHFIDTYWTLNQNNLNANSLRLRGDLCDGPIMGVGCYCLSIARLIAGKTTNAPFLNPVNFSGLGLLDKNREIDLYACGTLQFNDQCYATVKTSLECSYSYGLKILGEKGTIIMDDPFLASTNPQIKIISSDGQTTEINFDHAISVYTYEVEAVAAFIAAGKKQAEAPCPNWQNTLGNMQALDAWRKSIGLNYAGE